MSKPFRFYITSTSVLSILSLAGFRLGMIATGGYLANRFHLKGQILGLDTLGIGFVILFGGVVGLLLGILVSLVIIERLGRKWGKDLNFGSHPVLKLTFLSFLTFLGLLVLLLFLLPTKS